MVTLTTRKKAEAYRARLENALARELRVKDVSITDRMMLLGTAGATASKTKPYTAVGLSVRLGGQRLESYKRDVASRSLQHIKKLPGFMKQRLPRMTRSNDLYMWLSVESVDTKNAPVDPHLHGVAVVQVDQLPRFKAALQEYSMYEGPPSNAVRMTRFEDELDAFFFSTYCLKSRSSIPFKTRAGSRFINTAYERYVEKYHAGADFWLRHRLI